MTPTGRPPQQVIIDDESDEELDEEDLSQLQITLDESDDFSCINRYFIPSTSR